MALAEGLLAPGLDYPMDNLRDKIVSQRIRKKKSAVPSSLSQSQLATADAELQ